MVSEKISGHFTHLIVSASLIYVKFVAKFFPHIEIIVKFCDIYRNSFEKERVLSVDEGLRKIEWKLRCFLKEENITYLKFFLGNEIVNKLF